MAKFKCFGARFNASTKYRVFQFLSFVALSTHVLACAWLHMVRNVSGTYGMHLETTLRISDCDRLSSAMAGEVNRLGCGPLDSGRAPCVKIL